MLCVIYLGFQFRRERLSLFIKFSMFQNNVTNGAVKKVFQNAHDKNKD